MKYTHEDLLKMDGVKITCCFFGQYYSTAKIVVENEKIYVEVLEDNQRQKWFISSKSCRREYNTHDCTNITVVEEPENAPEQETRLYTKDLTAEQIVTNLKNGMVIKNTSFGKSEEYKMVNGIICLFVDGALSCIGSDIVTWTEGMYFETSETSGIKVGQIRSDVNLGTFVVIKKEGPYWYCMLRNGYITLEVEDGKAFVGNVIIDKYTGNWKAAVNSKEFKGE